MIALRPALDWRQAPDSHLVAEKAQGMLSGFFDLGIKNEEGGVDLNLPARHGRRELEVRD